MAFPRFYFLSNDELLHILSNAENRDIIQGHLKTLFDGIVRIDYTEAEITHIISKEKEKMALEGVTGGKLKVKPGEAVEGWLKKLQDAMKTSIIKFMHSGYKSYGDGDNRKVWVTQNYGQIVATICQVMWCSGTEDAFSLMQTERTALADWKQVNDD